MTNNKEETAAGALTISRGGVPVNNPFQNQNDSCFATPQLPFAIDKVRLRHQQHPVAKLAPPVSQAFNSPAAALMRNADRIFNTVKVSKHERAASLSLAQKVAARQSSPPRSRPLPLQLSGESNSESKSKKSLMSNTKTKFIDKLKKSDLLTRSFVVKNNALK